MANGICTFFSCTTLLIIRPAAISSPHDTASSATTSALLNLPRRALVDDRLSSLSAAPALDPRRVQRGQRAGKQAGEHDQPEHEQHDPVIEVERDPERRRVDRQRLREPAHAERC